MLEDKRVLTCVYCGQEYPEGTPSWGNQLLTDHIKICDKHPMRVLEQRLAKLKKALIMLVGAETQEELLMMQGALAAMPIPPSKRTNLIQAIEVLVEESKIK